MKLLIRFGDLMLKGKNKKVFINTLNLHIKRKMQDMEVGIDRRHDRVYLDFDENIYLEVQKRIMQIPGIHSYSIVYNTEKDLDKIIDLGARVLNKDLDQNKIYKFKIETKRSDKNYEHSSLELTKLVASKILEKTDKNLIVDVKNPDVILNINVRTDGVYMYLNRYKALGGFPSGIAGKGILMLSGGIDSPVAGFLSMKQGVELELIHFESSPLTPLESVNKVYDLARKLSVYLKSESIKLHIVPFTKLHEALLNNVKESYVITIMRRMMYRIAEQYANLNGIEIIVNGESLGQVASQTLNSLKVVENVTNIPIIRPLATYDKNDVIEISKKIDAYDVSIRPFNDCCSIYVPKNPVTKPTIRNAEYEEAKFDYSNLVKEAVSDIKTIYVKKDKEMDFSMLGFTFLEAYNNMEK